MVNVANRGLNADALVGDIPDGQYVAAVTDDVFQNDVLILTFTIREGDYVGRTIKSRYALWSTDQKILGGAKYGFAVVCKACGVNTPRDSSDLRGIPIVITVTHREYNGNSYPNIVKCAPYQRPQQTSASTYSEAPF